MRTSALAAAKRGVGEPGGIPAGVGLVDVRARRDDIVDPVEHLAGQTGCSSAASWLSSCSIVRGPMIAAVTAGWRGDEAERHLDQRHARPARQARRAPGRPLAWPDCPEATCRSARGASARGGSIRATRRPCRSARRASRRRAGSTGSRPCRTAAGGQHVALDGADQHRVGRLLADEALAAAPFGDPLRLDDLPGREVEEPIARTLPAATRSLSAPSVWSMSVSGSGRWIW